MLGIIVILAISWALLFFIEKKNLLALGVLPVKKRALQFVLGLTIAAALCVAAQYLESFLKSSVWVVNDSTNARTVLLSLWWDVRSILTEELIFRGALLYILLKKLKPQTAILISAAAFGVYHWFSYGVLGQIVPMALVFISTGFMGYVWALAFAKTNSIMLPVGFHLGWNAIHNSIFSKGPLGDMLLVSRGGHELTDGVSLLNFLTSTVGTAAVLLVLVVFMVKQEAPE